MNELFSGLHKTTAEIVVVKVSQVIELIGVDATERLHEGILEIQTAMTTKKRTAIPKDKRVRKEGFGRFNRLELIKAIQNASTSSTNHRGSTPESEGDQLSSRIRTS